MSHELLEPFDRTLFDVSGGIALLAWAGVAALFGALATAAPRTSLTFVFNWFSDLSAKAPGP